MDIKQNAMTAYISISQWTGKTVDAKATKEISEAHHTTAQWARGHKNLISETALKTVSKTANAIRTYHYTNTLPWDDCGIRLLPIGNFMDYQTGINSLIQQFYAARDKLINNYESEIELAKANLNGLFNPADYPTKSELIGKFAVTLMINPIATSDDFRVNIKQNEADKIKQEIESRLTEQTKEATKDLYNRIKTAVEHVAQVMKDPEKIFRDSLFQNIESISKLVPKLNLTNDPQLNELSSEIKTLVRHPESIRNNPISRQAVGTEAQKILDKMVGF